MNTLIKQLLEELNHLAKNPKNLKDYSRFYKNKKVRISINIPLKRKIAGKYFKEIKSLKKEQIFELCEELLELGYREIPFDWSFRLRKTYQKKDLIKFESWLNKYVSDWSSCDDFCTHSLGYFILQYPELLKILNKWVQSKNMWLRRASAISLIYSIRRKQNLSKVFEIANILLLDKEDLVQKGYGWMLKEAAKHYEKEVFDFVMKHKKNMPRTALRYAIEKMPVKLKQLAMVRN